MDIQAFIDALKAQGIELTSRMLEQFELYYTLLVEWNEKMNLTHITQKQDVYLKHFYDSLTLAFDHPLSHETRDLVCRISFHTAQDRLSGHSCDDRGFFK